jgi:rfaE bifunctional protein kinase chain/domain
MLEKYKVKIVSVDGLSEKIDLFPRKSKVIMCHGVFDIVHPGHIRHLSYAKSKAEILVASITSDKFVKKGRYRPHVPEDLRALNLAAFEMVDFVIIDNNEKPLENIIKVKPDYFAKGYEYNKDLNYTKSTQEEEEVLKSYGGEILFTPGDIVYSSSNILKNQTPDLSIEKLIISMKNENITFNDLRSSLDKIEGEKVHILGDTIIDTYTKTNMIGGQTKTPTISVLFNSKENFVGGAGVVAKHLQEAGANVTFTTVVGNDDLAKYAYENLKESNIKVNWITDETRPTTNKNVIIADSYRLLKIDTLDNRTIQPSILKQIKEKIENDTKNILILSDFRHGIFNKNTIPEITKSITEYIFKVADSQVASRWGNITEFQGFDLITPNEREARFALADQDSTVGLLSEEIRQKSNAKSAFLKLGNKGMIATTRNGLDKNKYFILDSFTQNAIDPVGSGDALLAYGTLVLKVTKCILTASIIGSLAAACACELDGNMPVKKDYISNKLKELEKLL